MPKQSLFTSSDKFGIEIETREGKPPQIRGYAAVFYNADIPDQTQYMLGEQYAERIFPGAFRKMLQERQDVRALFNHDSNFLLGRSSAGTLEMEEDAKGLRYTITPPDTTAARDVMENIRCGNMNGSSFSFSLKRTGDDISMGPNQWREDGNLTIREIREFDQVFDVGPVVFPAYTGTSAMCRHEDPEQARKEFEAEIQRRQEVARRKREEHIERLAEINRRIQQ